jgi:predicted transcriptional regulator
MLEKLIQKINESKLSPAEISRRSGVPKSTISKILNGIQEPRISTYEKLIKALE